LQHVGTKSAKRKLRKLSDKERRFFKKDVNHVISKNIVEKAKGTTRGIGLEDLKNIYSRVTVKIRHHSRRGDRHHRRWSFDELRKCIEYKAKVLGVPIFVVPKNTSRQCPDPKCQHIDKRNRKTRDLFQCLQCRFTAMADYIDAINVRIKAKLMTATVNPPIVGETLSTYKPTIKSMVVDLWNIPKSAKTDG
jgi:putative transposase